MFINEAVCEGCGDCGVQSNCTSILPLETEFGRKRVDRPIVLQPGLLLRARVLPELRHRRRRHAEEVARGRPEGCLRSSSPLPEPAPLPLQEAPYNILITGIGGTGVITIGALLGMAAHLEGKGISALDMTGMSQKNGAVTSHVRIAPRPGRHPARSASPPARPT